MTDNDFFKATEICLGEHSSSCAVEQCPFDEECGKDPDALLKYALALINRLKVENSELVGKIDKLQAEIERLKDRIKYKNQHIANLRELCKKTKSEAIKEFAERLKNKFTHSGKSTKYGDFTWGDITSYEIDNLLAEMTDNSITKVEHNSLCETETYEGRGAHKRKVSDT